MAYSQAQIDKIGNLLVYITSKLGPTPKTKLLKLIYIIEEEAVKQSGVAFTDLSYTYMPLGPVSTFVNKQIDKERDPIAKYVAIEQTGTIKLIKPIAKFNDDEFSAFDLEIIDEVLSKFGNCTAAKLIDYTHRSGSLWREIHDKFDGEPPIKERDIDLLKLLDKEGVDEDLRDSANERKAFINYLTSEE